MTLLLSLLFTTILTLVLVAIQGENSTVEANDRSPSLESALIPVRVAETEPYFRSRRQPCQKS
jgi:hypothetical protein